MKKMVYCGTLLLILLVGNVYSQTPSAAEILKKADDVMNAPQDQEISAKMMLIDKGGNENIREMKMYQKGKETRLVRFLSPADQKGVSFLSLPDDVQYLYLPAFHKVRRIASHVKNDNFAGTDFSYDDMSASKYSEEYDAVLLEETDESYILELIPKKGIEKNYTKLRLWARKDNFYPLRVEFYDSNLTICKLFESRNIKKHGEYWVASEAEMTDIKKEHRTKMIIEHIELDKGLSDDLFTTRNLKRSD
jgi:outer membrane lipoprotein-sorting protein